MIKTKSLTPQVLKVVRDKGTEHPFTGTYNDFDEAGTYLCRQCGLALFRSHSKFHSGCGWPSFDDEIEGAVKRTLDADGRREEILCARCDAHLGHVFIGEGFTNKSLRHCVNSLSLDFVPSLTVTDSLEAIVAGGCFWGIEYLFKKQSGILKTEVGYIGGDKENPTYQEICSGGTGYLEGVRVLYDVAKTDYETVLKYFFEIHDPSQLTGQGPDIGEQYQSAIFYYDETQKDIAEKLIEILKQNGHHVVTKLRPVSTFWPAEKYHQDYYNKKGGQPYCHRYVKRF